MVNKVQSLFTQAMESKLPKVDLEPLFTESAVDKALFQSQGLETMSRKQLRSLVSLMELRYHMLMSKLSKAAPGVEMVEVQGRLNESMGLMQFLRHLLFMKEEATNG